MYCKFRNFREICIFANSVKRHIIHVKNSQLGHDLSTSVNDRVISLGFYVANFENAKFRENKTLAKISEFTVILQMSFEEFQDGCQTLYPLLGTDLTKEDPSGLKIADWDVKNPNKQKVKMASFDI